MVSGKGGGIEGGRKAYVERKRHDAVREMTSKRKRNHYCTEQEKARILRIREVRYRRVLKR
jgi:hypothetical protein